ncbi:hypothetical protein OHB12_32525 [Nocardia sp. NBC_01730]|uniref:hypothetical protein n=1 Tax=Nocardia sp. NBC_01730 TaxID=2975998 RepID=UPI002E153134|nr:hypothetical protein OHB12_32525 [Nocardia sp. NBC_01730]
MDAAEITAALAQVDALPQGRARTERLETLAAAAKAGSDRALESRVLLVLTKSYTYTGEHDLALVAYGRLLRIYDDHPAELGSMTHSVHWYLKPSVALHLEFCALTGNEARGLEILAEHVIWLTDPGANTAARLVFATGVCVLLRRLVKLGLSDLPLGAGTVESVRADLEVEIGGLCARYDTRNGNSTVGLRTAARLAAQPLLDQLPLGVRSGLPHTTSVPAAVPTAGDFSGDRVAEARRLAELGSARLAVAPEAAEAHLREALTFGAAVLPQDHLARLGSQLVIAIASRPDRALDLADAAVRAAAHWEGLSEPDVLHHTMVAARAFHRAGHHGEAVALFDQAFAGAEIPYPPAELAVVRAQFGRSLTALNRHRDAAHHFIEGARLVEHDPDRQELHADLAWSAAAALECCGQDDEAREGSCQLG